MKLRYLQPRFVLWGALLLSLFLFGSVGRVAAAEFADGEERYILEADETLEDDLYIGGNEIYINGVVDGDVYVAGAYIEVNGRITGDLVAAGGSIKVAGTVEDDVRIAAGGIDISGEIGDDLFVAGGGGSPTFAPSTPGSAPTLPQGIFMSTTSLVGGDAIVVGGSGQIAGTVEGDVISRMGDINFGASVAGDADLGANTVVFSPNARVEGTVEYAASAEAATLPESLQGKTNFSRIEQTEFEEPSLATRSVEWLTRTLAILLGFAILVWLVQRFAPNAFERSVENLNKDIGKSAIYGLLMTIGMIFFPIISALIVGLVWAFGGVGVGLIMLVAIFSLLAIVWWIVAPLVTGRWLGERLFSSQSTLMAMLLGTLLVVLLIRVPFVGWFVALASFILALGSWLTDRFTSGGKTLAAVEGKPIGAATS